MNSEERFVIVQLSIDPRHNYDLFYFLSGHLLSNTVLIFFVNETDRTVGSDLPTLLTMLLWRSPVSHIISEAERKL